MLIKGACALPRQCAVRTAGSAHRAACAAAARSASSCLPGRRSPFGGSAAKVSRPCPDQGRDAGRSAPVRRSGCFEGGATPRRPPAGPPPCAGAARADRPPGRPLSSEVRPPGGSGSDCPTRGAEVASSWLPVIAGRAPGAGALSSFFAAPMSGGRPRKTHRPTAPRRRHCPGAPPHSGGAHRARHRTALASSNTRSK